MAGKKLPEHVKQARKLVKAAQAVIDQYETNPEGKRFGNACTKFSDAVTEAYRSEI